LPYTVHTIKFEFWTERGTDGVVMGGTEEKKEGKKREDRPEGLYQISDQSILK
jgi:hypothetical protein